MKVVAIILCICVAAGQGDPTAQESAPSSADDRGVASVSPQQSGAKKMKTKGSSKAKGAEKPGSAEDETDAEDTDSTGEGSSRAEEKPFKAGELSAKTIRARLESWMVISSACGGTFSEPPPSFQNVGEPILR